MKFRILLFILCLPCVFSAYGLRPLVWVIDAGHGGHDHGTEGKLCKEKDVNLNIARHLVALLARHKPGIRVITTRNRDEFVSLETRCRKANRANADLFLSIHVNSAPNRRLRGTETFYARKGSTGRAALEKSRNRNIGKSELLALLLQKNYHEAGRPSDRGIKTNPMYVTSHVMMPAVLTEVGFMSNTEDEKYLASEAGQQEIARMLFNALMEYYTTTQAKTHTKTLATLHRSGCRKSGVKPALHLEVKTKAKPKEKEKERPAAKEPENRSSLAETETGSKPAPEVAPAVDELATLDSIPVFSVQLFSCSTEMKSDDKRLKGLSPVTFVRSGDAFKCLYQGTTDYQQARHSLALVREKFPDAFIVAYLGEKNISTAEALEMVRKKQ